MDKIAVLIPCYNEGMTISKVISDYSSLQLLRHNKIT